MADYNAILRRTLEGLGTTTPELREKLFSRARATISRQLETADPPMSSETIAEQKAHLEAAIATIENEYRATETPADPGITASATSAAAESDPVATVPAAKGDGAPAPADPGVDGIPSISDDPVSIPAADDNQYLPAENMRPVEATGGRSTLVIVVVCLLIIGGGAAALWLNRTALVEAYNQLINGNGSVVTESNGGVAPPASQSGEGSQPAVSAVKPDEKLPGSTTVETAVTEKFDQRLNENGEEISPEPIRENNDTLPAGVEPSPVTTTRIVVPGTTTDPADPQDPTVAQADGQNDGSAAPVAEGRPAVFAQKGLLYEEGASQNQNSVDVGTVVWSIVQEAPADGQPLEPAIRARVEIANRNLILLMTIKRNADQALPASHIIELVFSVPDDFSGGGIDKIQRFVFKQNEQARGEALVGVPATIANGIFLIALNNLPEAVTRNTALMKEQEWIDIPLGYRTGRRALITIEKGVPGGRVFKEAFAAWEKAG